MDTVYFLIFNHVTRALDELVTKLRRPRIQALMRVFARQVQEIEDAIFALVHERFLHTSQGAQLDQWGALVGLSREGVTDSEYRRLIQARMLLNRSSGTAPEVIEILRLITGNHGPVQAQPLYPAGVLLAYSTPTPLTDAQTTRVRAWMEEALALGVRLAGLAEVPLEADAFTLDVGPGLDVGLLGRAV